MDLLLVFPVVGTNVLYTSGVAQKPSVLTGYRVIYVITKSHEVAEMPKAFFSVM
jgi:hypothetical protein